MDFEVRPEQTECAGDHELEPLFELGGPAYRLMQRIGIIRGKGPCIGRRTCAFITVAWLPLLLFSVIEGTAIGPTPRASLLLDFATYARFFVAVPLIFAAETLVGPRIRAAGLRFVQSGIVRPEEHAAFIAAAEHARRRRDAALPELLFLLIALIGAWFLTIEQLGGLGTQAWHTVWSDGAPRFNLAGAWYHFVAIPLVQFFLLRWLWRLAIWTLFLRDICRLRLNLLATHADLAGGVAFLGVAHTSLAVFPFAMSCVLAAELAFRIVFEGMDIATLRTMGPLLVAYLLFVELATFGPLLVLLPTLVRVRLAGLQAYGVLVQRHNQSFHSKWIGGAHDKDETLLGNRDVSSLRDLGASFGIVRQMSVFPVGRTQLMQVAVLACLPGLPLAFLVLPVGEVVRLLAGVIT